MTDTQLDKALKALADRNRRELFMCIQQCSGDMAVDSTGQAHSISPGKTIGEICCHLSGDRTVTSTISQRIKELREADLIYVTRQGRHMLCSINTSTVADLLTFFDSCTCQASKERP
ncbi:MAG: ArsR/SmtB family transcription factor [Armatimonadota bacterium]